MCGINGWVGGRPRPRQETGALIERMNAVIAHRGPDGRGVFATERVGLGHLRLSIIDLSEGGAQPMRSAEGRLALVFNGEIYNYIEIAAELKALGHVFHSHSDTEVLLHAYQQWGPDCVRRFNGMWAFAIWDEAEQQLFASRDRLGVKPFLYCENAEGLYFSSEIAGLRAALPLREANLPKLHDYLAYGYRTNNGETFFKGVHELKPGHNLIWKDGGLRTECYWQLPEAGAYPLPAAAERQEAYAELLRDAVRLRFRSDVPVALLQSGGVDSSVICSIVNDEIERSRLGPESVHAFTVTHPGHRFDESALVRELMRSCPHIRLHELTPSGEDLAAHFRSYVSAMQEPMGSAASYAHWRLMKAIRNEGVKVVINGQGADEALAGYGAYIRGYRMLDLLQTNPLDAWQEARAIRSGMNFGWGSLVAQTAKAVLGRRAASKFRARFKEGSTGLLAPTFHSAHDGCLPELSMSWKGDNLERHLRSQLRDYGLNQILQYEDMSSMSQGIEIRSPFVDYRLMEFAFALPSEAKFSRGVTKKILRDGFDARVPHSIIRAKNKIGFATPIAEWLQVPQMQALIRDVTETASFKQRSLWKANELRARLSQPLQHDHATAAWRFLMTANWLEQAQIENC